MKIFYNGRCITSTGKGKKLQGLSIGKPKLLITKYKFDKSIYDNLIPDFNTEFTNYTVEDECLDTENIVIRTIYSEELPTEVTFGSTTASARHSSLLEVLYLNEKNLNHGYAMFARCDNLTKVYGIEDWDTSKWTTISGMFYYCSKLQNLDLSKWNTSNMRSISSCFMKCTSLTSVGDISGWDVRKVDNFNAFVGSCGLYELNLSGWKFGTFEKGINFILLGASMPNLIKIDISGWDLKHLINDNVSAVANIFIGCKNLKTVIMKNTNYESVNNIINPYNNTRYTNIESRTADDPGTLIITGVDDITKVDVATAQSKYWNIVTE